MIFKRAKQLKKKWQKKHLVVGVLLLLLLCIVAGFFVVTWGIYRLNWQNKYVADLTRIIPLPAAKINDQFISYYDYYKNLTAAEKFFTSQKNIADIKQPDDIRRYVMEERLIRNILIGQLAEKRQVKLTSTDINSALLEIVNSLGSEDRLAKFLQDNYNLTISEYQKYFIIPGLLADKLNDLIGDDETINGTAKKKIQQAFNALANVQQFAEVVKDFSEDSFQGQEQLKYRGDYPQDIEDQLFNMNSGEITEILTLPDSLQIISLIDKDEVKGILTVKTITVKIKSLNDMLAEEKNKAQIKIYVY